MCEENEDLMEGLSQKSVESDEKERERLHTALFKEMERIIDVWYQKNAYPFKIWAIQPIFREFLEVLKKSEHSEQDLENAITTCEHAEMALPDCHFGHIIAQYRQGFEKRLEKKEDE